MNVIDVDCPMVTEVDWLGVTCSWSLTPVPAVTDATYEPGVKYAKKAQPSAVVEMVRLVGPVTWTAMFGTPCPAAFRTLTPIEPVAAE